MRARSLAVLLGVALITACHGSPTAPTAAALTVAISPNPLAVPAAGGKLTWDVTLRETAGVGIRLDRDEMVVVDSSGATIAEQAGFYSGCSSCSGEMRVPANQSMTFRGQSTTFLGPPRPGSFHYTFYYTDDLGHALSTTVTGSLM